MEFLKTLTLKHAVFGRGETVNLYRDFYANSGEIALVAVTECGENYGTFTVNVPDVFIMDDYVLIKNYSENEGVLEDLIENGVVAEPRSMVKCGFTEAAMCELLI